VGPKSAQRIGYHLLEAPAAEVERLAAAMLDVKRLVHVCPVCFSYATGDTCDVCANPERDATTICVVSEAADVGAIERTHSYRGLYHVLGGVLDPLRRKGPDQLHVAELMARLANGEVEEVILAMDATVEGETTATYVSRLIKATGVRVSRLASGLPVGGSLEYADEVTLGRAIEARTLL
jgi:recombination protein RecR